ncbi:MAG: DinB family protein [Candidatus Dormibacteraeota bacterium]|uniref:DinB family protein n=1 Tax=Candidatus Amunia macphersoniae TaxID=3127014 RepID=A0A934NAD9_9BACT|nr:DinB family protein [Candidatus Dormibacteraeota bacterium]
MSDFLSIPDTRGHTPSNADERETLIAFLDKYRETVLVKLDGLDRDQLARRLLDSRTTLLGLVRHLTIVEQWWFAAVIAGGPAPEEDPDDPDAEWLISDSDSPEQIVAAYRAAYSRSNQIARAAGSLDGRVPGPHRPDKSVRWILMHMLEETARHAGHADIVRELIDGRTGD